MQVAFYYAGLAPLYFHNMFAYATSITGHVGNAC